MFEILYPYHDSRQLEGVTKKFGLEPRPSEPLLWYFAIASQGPANLQISRQRKNSTEWGA